MAYPLLAEFRVLDRRVWFLAFARLVVMFGFFMVLPFLGVHLTVERGVPAVLVGLIWTVAGVAGAATQWLAGELCDRVGRRPLMLSAMMLRAGNLAGLGYAIAADSSLWLIGGLVVANNMLRAFFDPVANALVADLVPAEQRVAAYSLQRVGINIGTAAGPALAGTLASRFGVSYAHLFYGSVPFTLLAAFLVARIEMPRAETLPHPPSWRELLAFRGDRPFVRFLLATVAFYLLQAQIYQTLSIYAARVLKLNLAQIGTFFTVNGLLVVFLQLPAVAFIRRVGTRGALVVGCLGYAASYAAVGLTRGYASILVCVACVTLAEIITAPAQQTTVTTLAPLGRVGAYSGLYGLCQIMGQAGGPLVGTAALDVLPPRAAWFLLALFGVAAAATYRTTDRDAQRSPAPGP
jgi:predicted MFS family arabinose efflux permease